MIRGALRRWAHGPTALWYHPSFRIPLAGVSARTGIDPRRADHVLTWALDRDVVTAEYVFTATLASWTAIRRVHDEAYLDRLDEASEVARILGTDEALVPVDSFLEMWRRGVSGTTQAMAWAIANAQPAACLQGGFHHAYRDRGTGFCALNDVAIAITQARLDGFEGRIAIVDLDAHPPDGVADCLGGDDRVHIVSVAVEGAFDTIPGIVDRRVPPGTVDAAYLEAVDEVLATLPDCELLVYIAGADPLVGDRLGGLSVSEEGLRRRDERVLERFDGLPCVLLPAGGYTKSAWRVFAHTIAIASGDGRPVPEGYDPLLRRTRNIAKTLDPSELSGQDDTEWFTEEDLFGSLNMGVQREQRFLGHYTRHGLEYALTRYGLLATLRRMGFAELEVEMVATGDPPHQLRVTANVAGERARLIDLSLSIRKVGELDTLFIEWLSMTDPRIPFTPERPHLPGQEAPGLGMASDAAHLFVQLARRLDLHGVSYIPSHFHVAWMGRKQWTHVDPDERGRFRALCDFFDRNKVRLGRASRMMAGPGVPLEDGSRRVWEPELMAMPLSDALKQHLQSGEARASAVRDSYADMFIWIE